MILSDQITHPPELEHQNSSTALVLIQKLQEAPRDPELWNDFVCLYHRYLARCVKTALDLLVQPRPSAFEQVVEDIVQNVYLRLLKHDGRALRAFRGGSDAAISRYLRIIALNLTRNYLRGLRAQKRGHEEISIETAADDQDRKTTMVKLIDPDSQRELQNLDFEEEINNLLTQVLISSNRNRDMLIFQLYYFDDLDAEEIAEIVGTSRHAVHMVLSRTRQRISEFANDLRK